MDWYETVFEVIDMRSFSNLWYWIGLAVIWSTTSHWVLGVPYDMVLRARRQGGEAETDLNDMVRININRILHIGTVSGLWLLAFSCGVITMLG
ncbi:MAG: component of SufBCD complex, partial [Paracoccaceae bacterium]